MKPFRILALALVSCVLAAIPAAGEVARVEILSRAALLDGRAFGAVGAYQHLTGRVHFTVDPADARNRVIADLDKAPTNAAGLVELSADLEILAPAVPARGNGVALVDVLNRGRRTLLTSFNRPAQGNIRSIADEIGDGFLLQQGYTLVWVAWEFDVAARDGVLRVQLPAAMGVTGMIRSAFRASAVSGDATVGDLSGYEPLDAAAVENTLTWRDTLESDPVPVPRDQWRLAGNVVILQAGFQPGRIYELSYRAANPPISGLGFAVVRDIAAWIKYAPAAPVSAKYAYTFGSSQGGRFLRDFLYLGFNTDEHGRQVFDAALPHIAGAARTLFNQRWATPTANTPGDMTTSAAFPFADASLPDPASGADEGLLDNPRARRHQPKVFYTNGSVEYWGGKRAAALIHTTADGMRDVAPPDHVRIYFFAGTQHGPSRFPSTVTNGQQRDNPTDYWWTMRALLVAMDAWVRQGVAPPPSRYPRWQDGTLVRAADAAFPALPAVASPRRLTAGTRVANPLLPRDGAPGTRLPLLVPQLDRDGNELAGIRLPEVAVPLATLTGWNFRNSRLGATDQLYPLLGSYVPFAATRAERERLHDPRLSIEERYSTRAQYLAQVESTAAALVTARFLLPGDMPVLVARAGEHWDLLAPVAATADLRSTVSPH